MQTSEARSTVELTRLGLQKYGLYYHSILWHRHSTMIIYCFAACMHEPQHTPTSSSSSSRGRGKKREHKTTTQQHTKTQHERGRRRTNNKSCAVRINNPLCIGQEFSKFTPSNFCCSICASFFLIFLRCSGFWVVWLHQACAAMVCPLVICFSLQLLMIFCLWWAHFLQAKPCAQGVGPPCWPIRWFCAVVCPAVALASTHRVYT